MCVPALLTGLAGLGGAAAGGTALTAAAGLANLGTIVSVGGGLISGIQGMQAANQQAAALKSQAQTEAQLTATEDQRRRAEFTSAIATQRAELAARGIALDSVTAVALGRTAAQEMSFDSQAIRAKGAASQQQLSASERIARATGMQDLLKGTVSAAGDLLSGAPDLWPGFFH